jgi:exopolyphosphatase/pppGpp-phosphohydrolase
MPGTYQSKLAPRYATVSEEMQPERSVLVATRAAKESKNKDECIFNPVRRE